MSAAGRYLRTVMHLRPRQVWTRVARRIVRPRPATGPPPLRRVPAAPLAEPIPREDGWIAATRVRLLNIEHEFSGVVDWRPSDMPRLWTYTLNYFEDLPKCAGGGDGDDGGPDPRLTPHLLDSWIDANPPCTPDTWDPYPISIRVVNWIKWVVLREQGAASVNERVLASLASQLRHLEQRVEFDIAANHLMANAVALTVGGLFFAGTEGARWFGKGAALLASELKEQVGDDGGHFERSPMYHAVVLEQLLDVLNLLTVFPEAAVGHRGLRARLEEVIPEMLGWLAAMTHPDGGAGFFNDTTLGSTPTHSELRGYAARLGIATPGEAPDGVLWLVATDFFRMTSEDGRTVALFDAGVPKPSYQPGHAHSESLSFEVSRDGRRVFVNSGVSTYDPGPERLWQRGTAAHNTVRIDERDQSELWSSHRVGRRPVQLHAGCTGDRPFAAHNGYAYLPGRPSHNREMFVGDSGVEVVDSVEGQGEHLLEWFFHLHPDVTARVTGRTVELSVDGRALASVGFPFGAPASVETGTWHTAFNASVPNTFIHVALRTGLPFEFTTTIEWL